MGVVEAPAFQHLNGKGSDGAAIHGESSDNLEHEPVNELLIEQLRDILHAQKQLVKALPKMVKAARSTQLRTLMERHLQETEGQVERLSNCLKILGASTRSKPCKGMMGLVEEGEEVMKEGKKKDAPQAELAQIGAALRVEHYEIAAYSTARNLAMQLREPTVVELLILSLGEEQNAGQLLDQLSQPLMSVAKMPATVEWVVSQA